MSEVKTAFPLFWPVGRIRTKQREKNNRFQTAFAKARDACYEEVRRLGGSDIIVSTNIPLKRNGQAYHVNFGESIPDPGVAVYFRRKGKELCFACDCWAHVQDNMHAISQTISALRGIARWGTGDMMEAAFTGFMALPAPGQTGGDDPWKILGVEVNATEDQITEAFRTLAKVHHPDRGGNAAEFARIRAAHNMLMQNTRRAA